MKLVGDATGGARHWTRVAPPKPRSVVRARARHARDRRMHETPAQGRCAECGVEDNRRRAFPGAVQVQAMRPDVHEPPWWPAGLPAHWSSTACSMRELSLARGIDGAMVRSRTV